ncbi:MAG: 30S ribosomal protein S3 [Gammaproteobacteria bacterium]|nr:30S ribosomal protein S3 [Gammaproteobacteria bacterium]
MGHKVNPNLLRLKVINDWNAMWYADRDYAKHVTGDIAARKYISKEWAAAGISKIQIKRPAKNAQIIVFAARPAVIIGKKGEEVDRVRAQISKLLGVPVHITVEEVKKPELDAKLVADGVAQQLEKRIMFRRAMKRAVSSAMRLGAKGVKINVAGRLGGAEIARNEWYREGRVPLHTLRAEVDYGTAEAQTTYGVIGVKVWIFKGEVLGKNNQTEETTAAESN